MPIRCQVLWLGFCNSPASRQLPEQKSKKERAQGRGGEKSKRSDFSADSIVHDPGTTQASMNTHKKGERKERERKRREEEHDVKH